MKDVIALRSLLFTPGHREHMVGKALELDADAVILDLEDGVPWPQKQAARDGVVSAIATPRSPLGPTRLVRVNAAETGLLEQDLDAVVRPGLDGIVLPKLEDPRLLDTVGTHLDQLEADRGIERGSIGLLGAIESARGISRATSIATASGRLVGLLFGAEDFALDLGLPVARTDAGQELLFARSALVVAAAEGRILAIDQVWTAIHDLDGLRRDALSARALGFAGKCLIHPGQIATVNEVFRPSPEEIELAERVVAAYDEARSQGIGATMLGGQLVELPIVERATRLIRLNDSISRLA